MHKGVVTDLGASARQYLDVVIHAFLPRPMGTGGILSKQDQRRELEVWPLIGPLISR
jgi:hypothetical protein